MEFKILIHQLNYSYREKNKFLHKDVKKDFYLCKTEGGNPAGAPDHVSSDAKFDAEANRSTTFPSSSSPGGRSPLARRTSSRTFTREREREVSHGQCDQILESSRLQIFFIK